MKGDMLTSNTYYFKSNKMFVSNISKWVHVCESDNQVMTVNQFMRAQIR